MSWDKQTVDYSDIKIVLDTLNVIGVPYVLTELGKIRGNGLNDINEEGTETYYSLRKLEYANRVILDQMQRTHDCDSDDCIVSITFYKKDVPQDWKLEIYVDTEETDEHS